MSTPTPLPEEPLAIIFSMIGSVLLPAVMEELLFRGAVLHALRPAGEKLAIWLSALLFMGAHGSLSQWLPHWQPIGAGDRDLLYRNAALGYLDPPV